MNVKDGIDNMRKINRTGDTCTQGYIQEYVLPKGTMCEVPCSYMDCDKCKEKNIEDRFNWDNQDGIDTHVEMGELYYDEEEPEKYQEWRNE